MTARIAATTVIAVALAAPPAATADPVLAPLLPCYVVASPDDRQAVSVAGTGFSPDAKVDIAVDGDYRATVSSDATGALPQGSAPAPFVDGEDRPFSVTAIEQGTGMVASVRALVTRLRVTVRPEPKRVRKPVRFAGSGFTARRPVWAHYVRGGAERHRVRMAALPTGACGAFSARRRLFPFSPQGGRWVLQFDQQRRYERRPETVFFRLRVTVSEG